MLSWEQLSLVSLAGLPDCKPNLSVEAQYHCKLHGMQYWNEQVSELATFNLARIQINIIGIVMISYYEIADVISGGSLNVTPYPYLVILTSCFPTALFDVFLHLLEFLKIFRKSSCWLGSVSKERPFRSNPVIV